MTNLSFEDMRAKQVLATMAAASSALRPHAESSSKQAEKRKAIEAEADYNQSDDDEDHAQQQQDSANSPSRARANLSSSDASSDGGHHSSNPKYADKRARNNEAVRKCRSKKRMAQMEKEKKLIYLERGVWRLFC